MNRPGCTSMPEPIVCARCNETGIILVGATSVKDDWGAVRVVVGLRCAWCGTAWFVDYQQLPGCTVRVTRIKADPDLGHGVAYQPQRTRKRKRGTDAIE
jgi:hypothetical protein